MTDMGAPVLRISGNRKPVADRLARLLLPAAQTAVRLRWVVDVLAQAAFVRATMTFAEMRALADGRELSS
jgi:hypothetical protein